MTEVAKVGEPGTAPDVVDLIAEGRVDLIVNTPVGRGARADGYQIRRAAISAKVPCITTLAGACAAVQAIARAWVVEPKPLQELTRVIARVRRRRAARAVPTWSRSSAASRRARPGQFHMLRALDAPVLLAAPALGHRCRRRARALPLPRCAGPG